VRFQVLTAAILKITGLWDVVLRSIVEVDDVSEVLTASIRTLMMEAVSSETSVHF
jgi:hypothetical protein